MHEFLHVITPDELVERLRRFSRLPAEPVTLDAALNRRAAEDIVSAEDLPTQARSTVDGYAVRAEDTFGATESSPAFLQVTAAVEMGQVSGALIGAGQCAQIPTGGYLPQGADAVVMVEYTNRADGNNIEVTRPVTAAANVLGKGEDVRSSEAVIGRGQTLRPQEIGLLAALGMNRVSVYARARVAVISTGDEVVRMDCDPRPGQIRDANTHSISALIAAAGSCPISFEIVPDNADMLRTTLERGLELADVVTLSGGSSVGIRDLMVDVVTGLSGVTLLAHGLAIRPGKPTMLAERNGKAIFGLPGHPVSALIIAQVFLDPFLRYLQGGKLEKGPAGQRLKAVLASSVHSVIGLEEYVRVALKEGADGVTVAEPVFGKSGMLSTMVKADGIVVVPMNAEGFSRGETVEVVQW